MLRKQIPVMPGKSNPGAFIQAPVFSIASTGRKSSHDNPSNTRQSKDIHQ
jgi:hypothetical protein